MLGGLLPFVLALLHQFSITKGSTLIREDEPGAEKMPIEFGYDPNSPKGEKPAVEKKETVLYPYNYNLY